MALGSGVFFWCMRALFIGGLVKGVAGLGLPLAAFVPAVSLMFFVGAAALALGLLGFGVTAPAELVVSAIGCVPVFLGLWLGQKLRLGLDQRRFERIVLVIYLATGLSFI